MESHSFRSHPGRLGVFKLHPPRHSASTLILMVFLFHHHPLLRHGGAVEAATAPAAAPPPDASPPVFTEQPKAVDYVPTGRVHVLSCAATARPAPEYRWWKKGAGFVTEFSGVGLHRISALGAGDFGVYRCVARNALGAVLSREAKLVEAKLKLEALEGDAVRNETLLGRQGESLLIQLASKYRIEGQPEPVVQWIQVSPDGSRSQIKDDGGLRFVSAAADELALLSLSSRDRNKRFRAQVLNPTLGLSLDTVFWNIQVEQSSGPRRNLAPEIVIPPRSATAKVGDSSVAFDCVTNAHPIDMVRVKWRKNGVEIHPSSKFLVSSKSKWRRLLIANPSTTDSGTYSCEASLLGYDFAPARRSAVLTVNAPPSFDDVIRNPLVSSVRFGDALTVRCGATGAPRPEVTWYKDGAPLEITEDIVVESDGAELILQRAGADNAGVYQCFASNVAGVASVHTYVKVVTVAPVIETAPPKNVSVVEGEDVMLPCGAVGAPRPTIAWRREDGASLGNAEILPSGALVIRDAGDADAGSLCCEAKNRFGAASVCASVNVAVKTRITAPPKDVAVIISLKAALFCGVTHDPTVDVDIKWTFEGRPIPSSGDRIRTDADGTLRIRSVRHQDAGTYSCRVASDGGDDQRSAVLSVIQLPFAPTGVGAELDAGDSRHVIVKWAAPFDGNSPVKSYIVQAQSVARSSKQKDKSSSSSKFLPEGLHNWKTVATDVSASETRRLLVNLSPATSYKFRVAAINRVGEGEFSTPSGIVTIPQEAPSEPPRLWASSASTTTIMVEWQPPPSEGWNGVLAGFVLEYRLSGYTSLPWTFVNISDPGRNQHLIGDLMVWKLYSIRMAAFNGKGVGVYSPVLTVRTREGVPEEPPRNVMASVINSTSVHVFWSPPPRPSINGINQGYKILAFRDDDDENKPERIVHAHPDQRNPEGRHDAVVNGLGKFEKYHVTVLCFTSAGDGRKAEKVPVATKEDIPDKVAKLEFVEVLDRSIAVHWEPPMLVNGILINYALYHEETGRTSTRVKVSLSPDVTGHVIEGLKPETSYTISVAAATIIGEGPKMTSSVESGVPPEAPQPPENLAISDITADSALLQYNAGFNGKTSITKWIVEGIVDFKEDQIYRNDWRTIFEATDLNIVDSFRIRGLKPYTWYQLRVVKENIMGRSGPSRPTRRFQTLQSAPRGAPENVIIRAMNATALRVTWTPLPDDHWNGSPAGYKILYYPEVTFKDDPTTDHILILRDPNVNTVVLNHLHQFTLYNVKMSAFNDYGHSSFQFVGSQLTMESTPDSGPEDVKAVTGENSATQIDVSWGNVPRGLANGIILGFKIRVEAMKPERWRRRAVMEKGTDAGDDLLVVIVPSNSTRFKRLDGLKKYTTYSIRISAFTRMGEGVASPAVHARTGESTPGAVSNVRFPHVTFDEAEVTWEPPLEPNGIILGYQVKHWLHRGEASTITARPVVSPVLTNDTTKYEVKKGLEREKYYYFVIRAKTRLGWGEPKKLLVYTVANRRIAEPPGRPSIGEGQVEATSVTMNWNPGDDGYAPIRYFTIQQQLGGRPGLAGRKEKRKRRRKRWNLEKDDKTTEKDDEEESWSEWKPVGGFIDPSKTSFTLQGLRPHTEYRFRVSATNDVGTSAFSAPSNAVITLTASPEAAPESVRVVPIKEDVVQVAWSDPPKDTWNGPQLLGYVARYRQISNPSWQEKLYQRLISDASPQRRTLDLENLVKNQRYEVQVFAYNIQGPGRASPVRVVDVGVAIPSGAPRDFNAIALSSTEVNVTWAAPLKSDVNGNLLGYKLFMWRRNETGGVIGAKMRVVGYKHTHLLLANLSEYTTYHFKILAYNSAGDGKNSTPSIVTTHQDLPSAPDGVFFSNLTLGSVRVNWGEPGDPNGVVLGYEVVYEDEAPDDGVSKTVRVQVPGAKTRQKIRELRYRAEYEFKVRAKTRAGWGPFSSASVVVGPQLRSPAAVENLRLEDTKNYLVISWEYGDNGFAPVGFILEKKSRDDRGAGEGWDRPWEYVAQEDSLLERERVSWKTLKANSEYKFRVIAYNYDGPSLPTVTDVFSPPTDLIPANPLRTAHAGWYKEWWFRITMAMGALVVVTVLVAALVVVGRNKRTKDAVLARQKALQRVEHVRANGLVNPGVDGEDDGIGNGGFATCDTKKSIRKSIKRVVHHGGVSVNGVYRPPPLPTPAAIYEEEENDLEPYTSFVCPLNGDDDADSHSSDVTTDKDVDSLVDENEAFCGRGGGGGLGSGGVGSGVGGSFSVGAGSFGRGVESGSPESGAYGVRAAMANGRSHAPSSSSSSSKARFSSHNSSGGSASPTKRLLDAASPMGGGSSGGSTSGSHRQLYFQAPATPSDGGSVSAMGGGCPLINARRLNGGATPTSTIDAFDTTSFVNHYTAANEALGQNSWRQQRPTAFSYRAVPNGDGFNDAASSSATPTSGMTASESRGGISLSPLGSGGGIGSGTVSPGAGSQQLLTASPGARTPASGFSSFV